MDIMGQIVAGYQVLETSIALAPGGSSVACKADPRRWSLTFVGNGSLKITTNPVPGTGLGIPLTTQGANISFNVRDHAALPQVQWNVQSSGGTFLTVIEVLKVN